MQFAYSASLANGRQLWPRTSCSAKADRVWDATLRSIDRYDELPATLNNGDVPRKNWYIRLRPAWVSAIGRLRTAVTGHATLPMSQGLP
jgi:hypothetical protein